jgi:hypothetical protein
MDPYTYTKLKLLTVTRKPQCIGNVFFIQMHHTGTSTLYFEYPADGKNHEPKQSEVYVICI